jgi:hypothetical protein
VQATGRFLAAVASGRSVLLGVAVALTLLAATSPWSTELALAGRVGMALLAGVAVAWWSYRKARGPGFDLGAVSLWIEERVPALRYALVTAIEPGAPAVLEQSVATVDWNAATREAARKSLRWPLAAVLAAALLFAGSTAFAPTVTRLVERVAGTPGRAIAGVLDVTVQVQPPGYSRRPNESFRNPPVVRALVGSQIRVTAAGRSSLQLSVGDEAIAGSGWRVSTQPGAHRVQSGDE